MIKKKIIFLILIVKTLTMRNLVSFLLLLIIGQITVKAQETRADKKALVFLDNIQTYNWLEKKDTDTTNTINFDGTIQFIDGRFNNSSIGYTTHSSKYKRLTIEGGIINYLNSKIIGNKVKIPNSKNLLCIIHNFIIVEADTTEHESLRISRLISKLYVKVDVFVENNQQFFSAFRFDTVLTNFDRNRKRNLNIINEFNSTFIAKIDRFNFGNTVNKKSYTFNDIQESLKDKLDLPILKNVALKKGVYANFNEFVQNKPSVSNYEIKKDKLSDQLFVIDKDGNSQLTRKAFGYCDGQNIWIYLADNFFILHRKNNYFEFYGFAGLSRIENDLFNAYNVTRIARMGLLSYGGLTTLASSGNAKMLEPHYRPYELDLEKGRIF